MPKNHTVKLGFFKGPQIQLHSNARIAQYGSDKYPFQFGLDKARMVLDCIDEIRAFVASNGQSVSVGAAQASTSTGTFEQPGPGRKSGSIGHGPDVDRLYEDQCARECGF